MISTITMLLYQSPKCFKDESVTFSITYHSVTKINCLRKGFLVNDFRTGFIKYNISL